MLPSAAQAIVDRLVSRKLGITTNMGKQNGTDKEQPALLKSGFARQTRKYIQLMDELRACG